MNQTLKLFGMILIQYAHQVVLAILIFGDRLWFTSGKHGVYTKVPLTEEYCELYDMGYDQGGCQDEIYLMGSHYWRYIDVNGDCNDGYPIFLMYDNHTLHGWGVTMINYDRPYPTSSRWDEVIGAYIGGFFLPDELPTCLAEQEIPLNVMHVYMTSSVLANPTLCEDTITMVDGFQISDQLGCDDQDSTIIDSDESSGGDGNNGNTNGNNDDNTDNEVVNIIIGVCAAVLVLIVGFGIFFEWRNNKKQHVQQDTYYQQM